MPPRGADSGGVQLVALGCDPLCCGCAWVGQGLTPGTPGPTMTSSRTRSCHIHTHTHTHTHIPRLAHRGTPRRPRAHRWNRLCLGDLRLQSGAPRCTPAPPTAIPHTPATPPSPPPHTAIAYQLRGHEFESHQRRFFLTFFFARTPQYMMGPNILGACTGTCHEPPPYQRERVLIFGQGRAQRPAHKFKVLHFSFN